MINMNMSKTLVDEYRGYGKHDALIRDFRSWFSNISFNIIEIHLDLIWKAKSWSKSSEV